MRIGLDALPLVAPLTGIGHYTLELARALAAIAPQDQFELVSPDPLLAAVSEELRQIATSNLTTVQPPKRRLNRFWWSVGLPRYLAQSSLDLFHGTNYEVPLWNRQLSILTVHDLSLVLHGDKHERGQARRARRRLPLMLRSAAMIITPTESVKRELCEHFGVTPDKVAVTPEAPRSIFHRIEFEKTIDTRRRLGIRDDFILFVGTIEPRKNLLTLVRAIDEILRTTAHRQQLVIAGKQGWLVDDLFSFIKTAGLGNQICFTGYLSDEDLCALYSSCKIFIYPSLYEGFGLPPLEAMACGAPVITSNIPAIRETVEKSAWLVNPTNVDNLARTIVQLLEDNQARERLSFLSIERAKIFTWERTASRTLEVYEKVLGGSRSVQLNARFA